MTENPNKNYERVITDLRKSLAWMDLVLSNLQEGVFVVSSDMNVLFANDAIASLLQKDRIFLLGLPVWKALPLIDGKKLVNKTFFIRALKYNNGTFLSGVYTLKTENQIKTIEVKVAFIAKINQSIFVIQDITEKKKHEKERLALVNTQIAKIEIEKERQRLYKLFMQVPIPIAILKGSQHIYELSNAANNKAMGKEITIGKSVKELFPESEKVGILQLLDIVYQTGKPYIAKEFPLTLNITGKEMQTQYINAIYEPLFDTDKNIEAVMTIGIDVTEQVIARQKIEETNKRKDDFINMASHELKTPLTSMKVFHQITQRLVTSGEIERSLHFFAKLDNQINKLTELISELLNLSRIQAGKFELEKSEFDLIETIKDTIESLQATTDKHTLTIQGRKTKQYIFADRDRINQVLTNLIANAIKYSPDGGPIRVAIKQGKKQINVVVKDTGIGIAKDHQKRIFERFYQVTGSKEKTFPGLGIGLYISAEIVQRHGGTMDVKSKKGKGSVFSFTLPIGS